jgi:hypothetical protein
VIEGAFWQPTDRKKSSRLQGANAVDVHQGDELGAISNRIDQDHMAAAEGEHVGVPDLIMLVVGKPKFERRERLTPQPVTYRVSIHVPFPVVKVSRQKVSRQAHYITTTAAGNRHDRPGGAVFRHCLAGLRAHFADLLRDLQEFLHFTPAKAMLMQIRHGRALFP